ncbi:MAG: thiamine pyrophosphate-dependent enzyme [Sulfolobales archaeon]|nr:thiamine pyrophosphate-dependent enzyme [Sulfolobales archaeon]MDW7969468.1 thiamine pyrophosphate-dependent enzyme [Sulfolobales archaeon]
MSSSNINIKELAKTPPKLLPGHRHCPGCTTPIIVKLVLSIIDEPIVVVNATGCLQVGTSIFPYTSWLVPWIHNAFENAAATASGVEAAFKALKRRGAVSDDKVNVLVFGGDGGTYDIGFQSLSGMIERGHNVLYVLYDNEAYMNTGIQRSGGTPYGASTTTSPHGKLIPGKPQHKKPIADIVVAHKAPYVATATPAHWVDLINKVRKALTIEGPKFLHVLSPCPRGWRFDPSMSIEICRIAVDTCYFPLWEYERGTWRLTDRSLTIARNPTLKKPIDEFIKIQERYRHAVTEDLEIIKELQTYVDALWEDLLRRCLVRQ